MTFPDLPTRRKPGPFGHYVGMSVEERREADARQAQGKPAAAHTCGVSRGLTPGQLTDRCPRCQQLGFLKASTEQLLDALEDYAVQITTYSAACGEARLIAEASELRVLIRAEILDRLGAQYRAGLEAGKALR